MHQLYAIVVKEIRKLGEDKAAEFFDVSVRQIRQWLSGSKPISIAAAEKAYVAQLEQKPFDHANEGRLVAAEWDGKDVTFCLPWYKVVNPASAFSVMAMRHPDKTGIIMVYQDAFISHTRNRIAQTFLKGDSTWSMWFDDDMIFPMGNAAWYRSATGFPFGDDFAGLHTVNRLLSHNKSLIGGLYYGRTPAGRPMYSEGCTSPQEAAMVRRGPQDTIKPTRWVATGCMLAHRSVYEDILKKFPQLGQEFFSPSEHDLVEHTAEMETLLTDPSIPTEDKIQRAYNHLKKGQSLMKANSQLGTGEDVIFCLRATAAGHQPYVDLGLVCAHVGACNYGPFNTHPPVTSDETP